MGSIPYNSVNDFNPISPTAGSKLDEKVEGQVELNGRQGTFGLFTGGELLWLIEKR